MYSIMIVTLLLPFIFQRRLRNVGYFSFVAMCATFMAVMIIIVLTGIIATDSVDDANADYHTNITEE